MRSGSRILVIEDDEATARLLELQLGQHGGDVEVASDPEAAVEIARATHPDLITLDLGLRPIGGFEVMRRLRDDPLTSSIPVIFISVSDHRTEASGQGAAGYIMKPYWPDTLYAVVDRVLGGG